MKELTQNRQTFYNLHKTRYPEYKRTKQEFQKDGQIFKWLSKFLLPDQLERLAQYYIKDNRDIAIQSKHSTEVFYYLIKRDYSEQRLYSPNLSAKKSPTSVSDLEALERLARMRK